jgi:K+-transporting ATPase KdpF subunit
VPVSVIDIAGLAVGVALVVFLFYALLYPEKL